MSKCNPDLTEALVAIQLREDIQRLLPDVESVGEEFSECFFQLLNDNPEMEATSLLALAVDRFEEQQLKREKKSIDESVLDDQSKSVSESLNPTIATDKADFNGQREQTKNNTKISSASVVGPLVKNDERLKNNGSFKRQDPPSLVTPLALPNIFIRFLPGVIALPLAVLGFLYALFVPETLYYALGIMLDLWFPVLKGWFGYIVFFLLLMIPLLNFGIIALLVVQSFVVAVKFIFGTYEPSLHGYITMYPALVGSIILLVSMFGRR